MGLIWDARAIVEIVEADIAMDDCYPASASCVARQGDAAGLPSSPSAAGSALGRLFQLRCAKMNTYSSPPHGSAVGSKAHGCARRTWTTQRGLIRYPRPFFPAGAFAPRIGLARFHAVLRGRINRGPFPCISYTNAHKY
jgi:hypothetical protein